MKQGRPVEVLHLLAPGFALELKTQARNLSFDDARKGIRSGSRISGGHGFKRSNHTTRRCRLTRTFWMRQVASERFLTILYGPVHGLCNFLDRPLGTTDEYSHIRSPSLNGSPCALLLYISVLQSRSCSRGCPYAVESGCPYAGSRRGRVHCLSPRYSCLCGMSIRALCSLKKSNPRIASVVRGLTMAASIAIVSPSTCRFTRAQRCQR